MVLKDLGETINLSARSEVAVKCAIQCHAPSLRLGGSLLVPSEKNEIAIYNLPGITIALRRMEQKTVCWY